MKKRNFSMLLVVLMSMISIQLTAHSFAVNNSQGVTIYYVYGGIGGWDNVSVSFMGIDDDDQDFNDYSGYVIIPESVYYQTNHLVTGIGDHAFYDCRDLTGVSIPESVRQIGKLAFDGCSSLTTITIPNSVTSIGENAFSRCTGLTSITIPNSVTSIGEYAFSRCTGLTSITIPNSVTSIGNFAFALCSYLTSVTVNSTSPITIDQYCFTNRANATLYVPVGCKAAYEAANYWKEFKEIVEMAPSSPIIEFADANVKALCVANWDTSGDNELSVAEAATVTDLGEVFTNNKNITSFNELQYFTGLTSINDNAFSGCSGLTSVAIPNSVTSIGESAFWGTGLTSITIPNSVTSIGDYVFSFCSGLTTIVVELGNPKYDSRNDCNAIIETATNTLVTGCMNTVIPNSVTSIGDEAFYKCTGLTSVYIPNSVTSIGSSVFRFCTDLTSVTIPNSVTSIGEGAFADCTGLQRVNITDLEAWCNISFASQTANPLTKAHYLYLNGERVDDLVIPSSVEAILKHAFSCGWFSSVTIPSTTFFSGSGQFRGAKIGEITLNISVNSYAFYYATINHLVVSPTMTYAGNLSFYGATIDDLEIPYSENDITWESGYDSYGMFENATIGTAIVNRYIKPSFGGNKNSAFYRTNISKLSIGSHAIYSTDALCAGCRITDLFFDGITEISSYAFYYSSNSNRISNIHLPYGLSSIGSEAFRLCSPNSVIIQNETPIEIDGTTFGTRTSATLFVPAGSKAAYESADNWKDFNRIVELPAIEEIINFADSNVKGICVAKWDQNGDGELSNREAAVVTDLNLAFNGKDEIVSFNEFRYFIGVQSINSDFKNLSNLQSINIPMSIKTVCQRTSSCFEGCTNLTSIIVDEGNTVLDSRNNCNAIIETATNILVRGCNGTVIPNNVTEIGYLAYSRSGLTSIVIPNNVTIIGGYAFNGCTGLISVTIPNSVTSISWYAFDGCSSLTSVIVENEIPLQIESNVFSNRANATLYVPAGSKAAYEAADYWNEFKEIVEMAPSSPIIEFADANVKALCVQNWDTNGDGELSEAEAAAVTSLGRAFKNNRYIKSFNELRFFTGLTSIQDEEFYYCTKLSTIIIPKNVTSIGRSAFFDCESLNSLTIPSSVNNIGNSAFLDCGLGLTSITVESGNSKYDSRNNCNAIIETETNKLLWGCNNTIIPNSVTSIDNSAFSHCMLMTTINIPDLVTNIGDYAFYNCEKLTSVVIPDLVTTIGEAAFWHCDDLLSVTIGEKVESIGSDAFSDCYNLTSVTIPKSVTSIGEYAFRSCSGLTTIVVEPGNPVYDSRNDCNAIIQTATNKLVFGCMNTIIPNSVTSIGSQAFRKCSGLTSVTIPNSVTSIGDMAFAECSGLTSVIVKNDIPLQIASNVFSNRANATLYVPAGSKAAYEAADYWKEFKEIIEMPASGDLNGDGIINGVDLVAQTNLILTDQYNAAADLNNDGVVNGLDYVIMVNMILSETSAPAMQVAGSNRVAATSSLSIEDFDIKAGETKELFINLSNPNTDLTLLQFDMRLPEGLSIAVEDDDYAIDITGRTTWKKHSLMAKATNGITRFLLASKSNALIDGDNGNVISIKLTASDGFASGDICLENQLLVSPDAEDVMPADFIYSVGGTTSIDAMGSKVMQLEGVYDLQGRRVKAEANSSLFTLHSSLKKGVYIVNGKKVIVK